MCRSLFFNKVAEKEALIHVFSCEFCEISKNAFLHRTPLVAASDISQLILYLSGNSIIGLSWVIEGT